MSVSFRVKGLSIALAAIFAAGHSAAQEWQTTSSLMGESKYGQNFQRYDYVNPDAPKGGTYNSVVQGSFDSLNPYIVRGTPAAGLVPFGGGLLYDMLMEQATDEASVSHPLVADAYRYPPDYSSATYRLDTRAKWHDGKPITVEDIVWSFQVLKANSPYYSRYFENVTEAVALNDREVEFRFDQKATGNCPRSSATWPCCPSIGGRAPTPRATSATSPARRSNRRWVPRPTGSPASSRARRSPGNACPTIGAPRCR
jgi:microcin C transport system substrate-binding protein